MYNNNMNEEEVNKQLQASGIPLVITVPKDDNGTESLSLNILDTMNSLHERLGQLEQINKKNQSEQLAELRKSVKQQTEQQRQQQDFQKKHCFKKNWMNVIKI
ncbi:hypothetical protein GCM10020331_011990 [Ectobacillus funiculus]